LKFAGREGTGKGFIYSIVPYKVYNLQLISIR